MRQVPSLHGKDLQNTSHLSRASQQARPPVHSPPVLTQASGEEKATETMKRGSMEEAAATHTYSLTA